MRDYKTTFGGVTLIGIAVLQALNAMLNGSAVDYNVIVGQIMAGIALIFAKDS